MAGRLITYQGETKNISEWAKHFGMLPNTLVCRMRSGKTFEQSIPSGFKNKMREKAEKSLKARRRSCRNCGKEFYPRAQQLAAGIGRFCSHKCCGVYRNMNTVKMKVQQSKSKAGRPCPRHTRRFTAEQLRGLKELIFYDSVTGSITWKKRAIEHFKDERSMKIWNTRYAGRDVGNTDAYGYVVLSVKAIGINRIAAHRAAWIIYHGKNPVGVIDHINEDKKDNRIENLRDVSVSHNSFNRSIIAGVVKVRGDYSAAIMKNGVMVRGAARKSFEAAKEDRKRLEIELFGESLQA